MFSQGLSQLQKTLNAKADAVQHEFIAVSERLNVLARKIVESEGDERQQYLAEQESLHARRPEVAEMVNVWRDRAREAVSQPGESALRAYLQDLSDETQADEAIQAAIKHVLFLINATDEELAALSQPKVEVRPQTPAGRLIERARKEYDLRGSDPAPRQTAAIEFANRPGLTQDVAAIAEIEDAIYDPDKFVREVALLTVIQLHRYRVLRLADLDAAYQSAQRLATINHPQVVTALVNIVETMRSGYVSRPGAAEPEETDNNHLRLVALKRLIEWHTPEARRAVEKQQLDRNPQVSYLARRALETFPGEWTKPLKGTGIWM